ncbi:hypothetical protein P7K49_007263 [Saguinus oedipus]|uniref:RNA-binding protein 38 n=1 Tax=Saguinus oedipus TaxID=9490 RepID=A0ABQ9VUF1_SAGOE|nr:hypothetical protein P7K49_007263 [Saguinus oedipus]
MADRAAAERACKDPNPIIDGRKANVNLAYLGAKPRIMQPASSSPYTKTFRLRKSLLFNMIRKGLPMSIAIYQNPIQPNPDTDNTW